MATLFGNSGQSLDCVISEAGSKNDISPLGPHSQNSSAPFSKKRRLRSSISASTLEGDSTSTQISGAIRYTGSFGLEARRSRETHATSVALTPSLVWIGHSVT